MHVNIRVHSFVTLNDTKSAPSPYPFHVINVINLTHCLVTFKLTKKSLLHTFGAKLLIQNCDFVYFVSVFTAWSLMNKYIFHKTSFEQLTRGLHSVLELRKVKSSHKARGSVVEQS